MPFQVSPGVNVSEIDLTTIVPAVSSTEGAIAGVFKWGPLEKAVLIDSETNLVSRFGKPDNYNAETFFTAANFLKYGNKLFVSRAGKTNDTTGVNGVLTAVANTGGYANTILIKNSDHYDVVMAGIPAPDIDVLYAAKYPGALGNSLKVSVCDSVSAYSSNLDIRGLAYGGAFAPYFIATTASNISNAGVSFINGSNQATIFITNSAIWDTLGNPTGAQNGLNAIVANSIIVGSILRAGNTSIGAQYLRVTSIAGATHTSGNTTAIISLDSNYALSTNYYGNTIVATWEYAQATDKPPGISAYQKKFGNPVVIDEVHVVVADHDGGVTGVPGTVLEVFESLSRATDAKTDDGSSNYYKTVLNQNSKYVWWINDRATAISNTALNVANSTVFLPLSLKMVTGSNGADESNIPLADLTYAYDLFKSAEDIDISLVLQGKARGSGLNNQLANYIIDNIVEARKDCVAYISPDRADVVNNVTKTEYSDIIAYRNGLTSTSYAVLDSGYKYQYDKYNDIYRYVPLNGDIAGLTVRTDSLRDPWWSPAGFNRGQIKNIVKLAYNPSKADRDLLYKSDINPVCVFPGQGTVLFGDKTLLGKPSAFDRINVRRLFIVLEKAIATAAKFTLFEFNDDFTRAQFRSLVEPFLRDIQGRRGIYDFRVVCDETNNTGQVIDSNKFVGDIYVKPARSINFIQLNFVAVRTGIEFSEIVGKF